MIRLPLRLLIIGLLVGLPASSAFADSSASVANVALTSLPYSHGSRSSTGTMNLTAVNDSVTGFNVTVVATDFSYSGPNNGASIPAANFMITLANAPVSIAGQAIDPTGGPRVPAANSAGALNVTRKVLQSDAAFGVGTYAQSIAISLSVPGQARAGTYTSTLTTTIGAAP